MSFETQNTRAYAIELKWRISKCESHKNAIFTNLHKNATFTETVHVTSQIVHMITQTSSRGNANCPGNMFT
jgi:hypothetical protein